MVNKVAKMRIYCKCGCNCKVNPGREYIRGHNRVGATCDNPRRGWTNEEYFGTEKASEISLKLSLAHKGRLDPRKGLTNEEFYGTKRAEEIKERASLVRIGKRHSMSLRGRENCRGGAIKRWKDPEYAKKQLRLIMEGGAGHGWKGYSSDGHFCASKWEYEFEEWLIRYKIPHYPHPRLPNGKRRLADQLINNCYVEVDGMDRDSSYWREKYEGSGIEPIILKVPLNCDYSFFNKHSVSLYRKLRTQKIRCG